MRTLLVGALVANLAGCSHQPPPVQTAADSCASRNRLACFMSVSVSLERTPHMTASAKLQSKPATPRKAQEAAVSLSTGQQRRGQDVRSVGGKPREVSLAGRWLDSWRGLQ